MNNLESLGSRIATTDRVKVCVCDVTTQGADGAIQAVKSSPVTKNAQLDGSTNEILVRAANFVRPQTGEFKSV